MIEERTQLNTCLRYPRGHLRKVWNVSSCIRGLGHRTGQYRHLVNMYKILMSMAPLHTLWNSRSMCQGFMPLGRAILRWIFHVEMSVHIFPWHNRCSCKPKVIQVYLLTKPIYKRKSFYLSDYMYDGLSFTFSSVKLSTSVSFCFYFF